MRRAMTWLVIRREENFNFPTAGEATQSSVCGGGEGARRGEKSRNQYRKGREGRKDRGAKAKMRSESKKAKGN